MSFVPRVARPASLLSRLAFGAALLAVPFSPATFAQDTAPAPQPAVAAAPLSDAERALVDDIRTHGEIMKNLEYLSDDIGPRLTGGARLKKANEWGMQKMMDYGLTNVHLEPYTIPIGWERGPITFRLLDDNGGFNLSAAQTAWTEGTHGKVTGPVVIVRATSEADLAQYKGKLKNAVVITGPPSNVARIPANPDAPETDPPATYNDYGAMPAPPRPAFGGRRPEGAPAPGAPAAAVPPQAAGTPRETGQPRRTPAGGPAGGPAAGARAFRQRLTQFLRDEGAAATLSDSGKPHGLLNMTGSWSSMGEFKDGKPERTPLTALFVDHDHYALLYRRAMRAQMENKPAPQVELEAKSKWVKGPVTVYNTVGEVRGSTKPDEFVVVGGHLDSWDLAQGTTDNGTGTCVTLEIARAIAKLPQKPNRTIRFVLFTGEEEGLYGSKEYVRAHQAELAKTSAAFVHDTGTGRVTGFGLEGRQNIRPVLQPTADALIEFGFKGMTDGGIGPSTDHWPFHQAGVPGFAALQQTAEYRYTHHSNSDTLDKARPDDLIQGAEVIGLLAYRVANLPDMLPRQAPVALGAPGNPRLGATGQYLDEDMHDQDDE